MTKKYTHPAMDTIRSDLAERAVREIRAMLKAGRSQAKIGADISTNRSEINRLLNRKLTRFSADRLCMILIRLGITPKFGTRRGPAP